MIAENSPSKRVSSRDALIRSGLELLTEQGFGNTGMDQILKRAGVPKGSFYHHFSSKNEFALVLIAEYNSYFRERLNRMLVGGGGAESNAVSRIRALVADLVRTMAKHEFRRGCLIGNFSQELGVSQEDFRVRLEGAFQEWELILARCLARGQQDGSVDPELDTQRAASLFWTGWEGAVMRSKLVVNAKPLQDFGEMFLSLIEKKPA